jgi:hypothetical protein
MAWQASRSSVVRRNGEWPRSEKREIGDSGQGWLPAPLHLACRQGTAHIDTATSCFDHRRTQGMQEIQANTLPPTSSKPVGDGKASRALWIVATGGVSVSWAEHCHQIERAMHAGVVAPPARQAVARPRRSGICLAGTTMCWWCVGCLEGCRGASKNVHPRVGGARCLSRAPGPRSRRAAKAVALVSGTASMAVWPERAGRRREGWRGTPSRVRMGVPATDQSISRTSAQPTPTPPELGGWRRRAERHSGPQ